MAHRITTLCIGCNLCSKNCPVYAISGTIKEQHIINKKRCIDCGVCGNICPKDAVLDQYGYVTEPTSKEHWKKPLIDQTLCSACAMCADICPKSCIQISLPAFKGDFEVSAQLTAEDQCLNCSMCAKICPLGAIEMVLRNK